MRSRLRRRMAGEACTSRVMAAALGLSFGLLTTYARAADDPAGEVIITPVLSANVNSAGQPIVFPQSNGHVTVSVFEIAPGATLPVHKHPFPRLGYVLSGFLRVANLQTGLSQTYKTGEPVLESVGEWHEGTNPGPIPLRLLVIDLMETGAHNTVLKTAPSD